MTYWLVWHVTQSTCGTCMCSQSAQSFVQRRVYQGESLYEIIERSVYSCLWKKAQIKGRKIVWNNNGRICVHALTYCKNQTHPPPKKKWKMSNSLTGRKILWNNRSVYTWFSTNQTHQKLLIKMNESLTSQQCPHWFKKCSRITLSYNQEENCLNPGLPQRWYRAK